MSRPTIEVLRHIGWLTSLLPSCSGLFQQFRHRAPRLQTAVSNALKQLQKRRDLIRSKKMPAETVKSVCLLLGPYRNLTTLTASTLFLHPKCQVLNHAATRIFGDQQIDFLADYSDERFNAFLQYAICISQSGKRGQYGGSIIHSHAFDKEHAMKQLFERESGASLLKGEIQSLVWKESLRTSNHIRSCMTDLDSIFSRNDRLRFLVPVRCPIDCAISNLKSGHARLFAGESTASPVERIVSAILREFAWIESLRQKHPDRFFIFFEYEMGKQTLENLEAFLGLEHDEKWLQSALAAFQSKKHYTPPHELVASYRSAVLHHFAENSHLAARFMRFVDGGDALPVLEGVTNSSRPGLSEVDGKTEAVSC